MTWVGFGLALIGWVLLVTGLVAGETVFRGGTLVDVLAWRGDVVTLAQTLIGTGFGVAIVGALRAGFGALTRFFDAVLQRSAAPRGRGAATLEPEPVVAEPVMTPPEPHAPRAPEIITVTPTVIAPERMATDRQQPPERPKPARTKDRNYLILPDGSVEVETMFGTRVFATLDEAKDFIR
ncbi:hypothetical protein P7D22_04070 [Lichenihabitans sp. Uapishka_5]|uniref:hypothetical protein n=1 Tax=Lichenihabitans sp. Uapishka_5 TaxID=3037302 RepID=UPI0029E8150E|nr:hypothetical protein [Lichenihabitans sp. Uapishka_5]MDX7950353.1 hypothetical protein [Lichenihabitans sp. Uapishka_5]